MKNLWALGYLSRYSRKTDYGYLSVTQKVGPTDKNGFQI